jgi:putative spermidine/putrescine transport system permease protein
MSTATNRRRNQRLIRWVVLTVVGVCFFFPLFSMYKFATSIGPQNPSKWDAFKAITTNPDLTAAIRTSLELCVLTALGMLVLLLPTMVWVRLKVPRAQRLVEFLCLLPLTIPAIVIVVGITNVQSWVYYLITDGPLSLTFPYIILVLPYSYRALDAGLSSIDVITLSEAARSLGASWITVLARVILPNIASAVLSAAFLAVALVLGEFTFASLLLFDNLQVVIAALGLTNASVSVAVSLASLVFASMLLFLLSFVGGRRRRAEAI